MNEIKSLSYSSTNVGTGAYVKLGAPTTIPVNNILVVDTGGQLMKLAVDDGTAIAAIPATLVNQTITYTSKLPGAQGNSITITIVNPGAPSSPLSVSVVGEDISISLQTNSMSALISTAANVVSAISANAAANGFVSATASVPSTVMAALSKTNLSGGTNSSGTIVDLFQLPLSQEMILVLPSNTTIPIGSQLYLKGISGTASSGYNVTTLLS